MLNDFFKVEYKPTEDELKASVGFITKFTYGNIDKVITRYPNGSWKCVTHDSLMNVVSTIYDNDQWFVSGSSSTDNSNKIVLSIDNITTEIKNGKL